MAEFWQWFTRKPKTFLPKQIKLIRWLPPELHYNPLTLVDDLSVTPLATLYYDKHAFDSLKRSLVIEERDGRAILRAQTKGDVLRHIQMFGYETVRVDWRKSK